jgi:septation ring formation regulator EzrA
MQICCNVSEKEYTEILRRAEEANTSKGKQAAELITYALAGGEKDEVARLERELAHQGEMLATLKEELGFMRTAFQTLEKEIAAPLAMLAEGRPKVEAPVKVEEPVWKHHWWSRRS